MCAGIWSSFTFLLNSSTESKLKSIPVTWLLSLNILKFLLSATLLKVFSRTQIISVERLTSSRLVSSETFDLETKSVLKYRKLAGMPCTSLYPSITFFTLGYVIALQIPCSKISSSLNPCSLSSFSLPFHSLFVQSMHFLLPPYFWFNSKTACPVVPEPAKKSRTTAFFLLNITVSKHLAVEY